jgi:uncharacterized protein YchJ
MYRDPDFVDMGDEGTIFMGGNQNRTRSNAIHTSPLTLRQAADEIDPEDPSTWGKVGRNATCPCGSGKKFKHCHGSNK